MVTIISLYTSRVVLKQLGVEDFGIYNLVGGVISVFSFVQGALADASQRFLTFEIGKGANGNVYRVFSVCVLLHIILGLIIGLLAEPIGCWLIYSKLNIPHDKLFSAIWVYQFTIVSAISICILIPYYAMVISKEKMKAFAMISLGEAGVKLCIAISLGLSVADNRLVLYAFLIMLSQIALQSLYYLYCRKNFEESKFTYQWDGRLVKEIGAFSSWSVIGNIAYALVIHGQSILLGMFFLPVVNAARGIAFQVHGAILNFIKNFQIAVNPQITKTFAAHQLSDMHQLIFRSSRFSYYLFLLMFYPLFFETSTILSIWLAEVPQYAVEFVRYSLLIVFTSTLANPLAVAAKASGKIKVFELSVALIKLTIFPISYMCLAKGLSPTSVYVVHLAIYLISVLINVLVTRNLVEFCMRDYFWKVIVPICSVTAISCIVPVILYYLIPISISRLFVLTILSSIFTSGVVWFIGMSSRERGLICKWVKGYGSLKRQ